jgi:hypothetical protein
MDGRMDRQTGRPVDTVQVNSGNNMSRESNSVETYFKGMWTENEYGKTVTMSIPSNLDTHRMRVVVVVVWLGYVRLGYGGLGWAEIGRYRIGESLHCNSLFYIQTSVCMCVVETVVVRLYPYLTPCVFLSSVFRILPLIIYIFPDQFMH